MLRNMWCINMYEIGDNVNTIYGKGKIIKMQIVPLNGKSLRCYLIKYSIFRKRWCYESSIMQKLSKWI